MAAVLSATVRVDLPHLVFERSHPAVYVGETCGSEERVDLRMRELLQASGQQATASLGNPDIAKRAAVERQVFHAHGARFRVGPDRGASPSVDVDLIRTEV